MESGAEACGEHAATKIDNYCERYALSEEWLGILVDPWYDHDRGVPQVQINVRTVDGPYPTQPGVETGTDRGYRYDLTYSFEGLRMMDVIHDVYPEIVDAIEEAFPAAQVEYDRPYLQD
jgi:hypothetical protein